MRFNELACSPGFARDLARGLAEHFSLQTWMLGLSKKSGQNSIPHAVDYELDPGGRARRGNFKPDLRPKGFVAHIYLWHTSC
jgi:hypothetical protein